MGATMGSTLVVEFMHNGELHKTIRWSSCSEMAEKLLENGNWDRLRETYAKAGAEILQVSKVESSLIHIA